jgi:hypothetical protein
LRAFFFGPLFSTQPHNGGVGSEPELRATARAFVVGAFAELTSERPA